MFPRTWIFAALVAVCFAPRGHAQVELANLREDVRDLSQRVGTLSLKVEQLERENSDLRGKAGSAEKNYATVAQLNEAIADLNRALKSAVANSKNETLQQVGTQMEKLAKQTNAALDSLARTPIAPAAPSRVASSTPAPTATFSDNFPKDGTTYVVQKGDSLASIAKKLGAKQQDIINANRLPDPSKIMLGETLLIPLAAPASAAK